MLFCFCYGFVSLACGFHDTASRETLDDQHSLPDLFSSPGHAALAITVEMFHKDDIEPLVTKLLQIELKKMERGNMKAIITVILSLASASVLADTSVKTSQIERWGYAQDQLVLFTQTGEALKVTPKLCSLTAFNEKLSSGMQVDIDIPASRIRQNTPFYVVEATENGAAKMKCRMASIDV